MRLPEAEMPWLEFLIGTDNKGNKIYSDDMPQEIKLKLEEFNEQKRLLRMLPVFKSIVESGGNPEEVFSEDDIKKCMRNLKVRPDKKILYSKWESAID